HRERGHVAHAVDEAEREDEPGVVAAQHRQRGLDTRAPAREAREQRRPVAPPDPEVELVAGEAARPGQAEDVAPVEHALVRGHAHEDDEGLALEERPDEDAGVDPRAVFDDQLSDCFDIHGRRRRWRTAAEASIPKGLASPPFHPRTRKRSVKPAPLASAPWSRASSPSRSRSRWARPLSRPAPPIP